MTSYLLGKKTGNIFLMISIFIPLKILGLYCAAVCKRGGKACSEVGVESDG
jgi:hypothetical protein